MNNTRGERSKGEGLFFSKKKKRIKKGRRKKRTAKSLSLQLIFFIKEVRMKKIHL